MQEHSDVEQQNYYLKSDTIAPSGTLHQLSLVKGDPFRKKKVLQYLKKTISGILLRFNRNWLLIVMTLPKYVNKGVHNYRIFWT